MCSKTDATCFVVSFTNVTSTHIKESSWVTIWIWKIKIHKHVNLLLSIGDLKIFLRAQKEHCIQTWGHYLSYLEVESGLGPKIKHVVLHSNFNPKIECWLWKPHFGLNVQNLFSVLFTHLQSPKSLKWIRISLGSFKQSCSPHIALQLVVRKFDPLQHEIRI